MNKNNFTLAIFLLCIGAPAIADEKADEWKFSLAPYLWLPTISGDLNYELPPGSGGGGDDGGVGVSVGPVDWLELLNVGLLIQGSVSKGPYSLNADLVYLSLSNTKDSQVASIDTEVGGPGGGETIPVSGSLDLGTSTDLDGVLYTISAGYAFHNTETSNHSVLLGVRRLDIDVKTDWSLTASITTPDNEVVLPAMGTLEGDRGYWDGIIGLRGRFNLGDSGKWSLPYYVDIGAGDSDLTWIATASISYQFNWGDMFLGYRHLQYDEGEGGLLENLTFSGPGFGAQFRF